MNLVKVLSQLGEKSSLKQFQSVQQLIEVNQLDESFLVACLKQSEELVCFVEPEDED